MKKAKIILTLAVSAGVVLGSATPAYALLRDGIVTDTLNEVTETVTDTTHDVTTLLKTTSVTDTKTSEEKIKEAREAAKSRIAELKKSNENRSKEVRQQVCENRKTTITRHLNHLAERSSHHKQVLDAILIRADGFVEKKGLTQQNLTDLRSSVDANAADVRTKIEELIALKGLVDCSDPDSVAAGLEAYRAQVDVIKEALKKYRSSIRQYLLAVKDAAISLEGENSSTEENE